MTSSLAARMRKRSNIAVSRFDWTRPTRLRHGHEQLAQELIHQAPQVKRRIVEQLVFGRPAIVRTCEPLLPGRPASVFTYERRALSPGADPCLDRGINDSHHAPRL